MTKATQQSVKQKAMTMLVVGTLLVVWVVPAQAQEQDLPTVTLVSAADSATEGMAGIWYRLSADPVPSEDLTVSLESEQTGDWIRPTLVGRFSVTIPAGQPHLDFVLSVLNDAAVEADGSVTLTVISGGSHYLVGDDNSVTVSVIDNDEPVTLEFLAGEELRVDENAGSVEVVVVATVDGGQRPGTYSHENNYYEGQEFSISTRSGTATSPDDFDEMTWTIRLPTRTFTQQESGDYVAIVRVSITIHDDADIEDDHERFTVILEGGSSTGQLTLPSEPLRIVIIDDDPNDRPGTVFFNWYEPREGRGFPAYLSDADSDLRHKSWKWWRADTEDGTFTVIPGATNSTYTPQLSDVGKYLKASVTYTDGHGPGKSAEAVSQRPVRTKNCIPG